jgi:PLD-like domain
MQAEFYLKTVDRRWRIELARAQSRTIIVSPYLTPRTAEAVIKSAAPNLCEIYTRFSVEDFASGSSSLRTLRTLIENGYALYEIDRVHAKLVLIRGQFASIGSQNITSNGVRNREATAVFTTPADVGRIEELIAPWIEKRTAITREMIDDLAELIEPIERQFRAATIAAIQTEMAVRQRESQRQEARAAEEHRRKVEKKRRTAIFASARTSVRELLLGGKVPEDVARRFLENSTWWHSHSSGTPVRAPRHANRMYGYGGDWKIDFGANTFLVGRAIERCARTIERFLADSEAGTPWSHKYLFEQLKLNVRGAVAGYNGGEYAGYYPVSSNDMMFGVTSIDVEDFSKMAAAILPYAILPPE